MNKSITFMVNCYYIYGGSGVLHLWLNFITFMVGQLLHLWLNVITFMVGITFMVVITFMGDTDGYSQVLTKRTGWGGDSGEWLSSPLFRL